MNKLLFFVTLIATCFCQSAKADTAKVKLKTGTELSGKIISLDPTCCIVLDVAGFETSINMADVESVERIADGTETAGPLASATTPKTNPGAHPAFTHKGTIKADKKGNQYIEVLSDDGQELTMDFVSKEDKTLKVINARKGLNYKHQVTVIPEYVTLENDIYTVITIAESAFNRKRGMYLDGSTDVADIVLPSTLKTIEDNAFRYNKGLMRIIIPDSVEYIGNNAFEYCGECCLNFVQLHIPENIRTIGVNAFKFVGSNKSFRGFFQGNLTSIPSFVTTGNCHNIGIDENAVEEYYRRNGK